MKKALIILPTHNEAGTIEKLIKEIFNQQNKTNLWELNVLVNDSESTDKTNEIVKKLIKIYPKKLFLINSKKQGLGKAYLQSFNYALENLKPYVIFQMDADFSHDPKLIPIFLKEIEKGADFVIGSRYIKGGSIPKNWGWYRKIFSIFGNFIVRFGFMKLKIHDWTSGYRAIKSWLIKDCLDHIKKYSGYVFQIALLDKSVKKNTVIKEIPLNFVDRIYGKSKIIFFQYIFNILLYLLIYSTFIKFVIVGIIGAVVDFGLSYLLDINSPNKSVKLITLISTESAIISNYLLNNFWSFNEKKKSPLKKEFYIDFLKFNFISSGSVIIQTLGMSFLTNIFGRNLWCLYKFLIIVFIIIPYSYILYNKNK